MNRWIRTVLDVAFPPHCRGCNGWMSDEPEAILCRPCVDRLDRIEGAICVRCGHPLGPHVQPDAEGCALCAHRPYAFCRAVAAMHYDDAARPLIHRFKYYREPHLKIPLARFLAQAIRAAGIDGHIDAITGVPLHWRRRAGRGYNQSQLLAQELGRIFQRPVPARLVRRTRATRAQSLLARSDRAHNVVGAFAAAARQNKKYKQVLLVDDVMTTGSTASACAQAMLDAGVKDVYVAVVAR